MKLVRFGPKGEERPGILIREAGEEKILDVRTSAFDIEDYNSHFFSHYGLERVAALLKEGKRKLIPVRETRLGPPIAQPSKIICLGKNYADHAKECNSSPPESPILFSKATTAINGPNDSILLPPNHGLVDGEVELAVVIGSKAWRVPEKNAMSHIAGYMIFNDVTDRDAQREGQQWFRGKSFDTFCPLGPWLVSADEIPDPRGATRRPA